MHLRVGTIGFQSHWKSLSSLQFDIRHSGVSAIIGG